MLEAWLQQSHAVPWLLVMAAAGALGALGHCAGMCGPLVAAFGMAQARRGGPVWPRHLLFQAGRILTYAVLGGLIGTLGGFARLREVQDMHECCRPEGQALLAAQAWPWQLWIKLGIGVVLLGLGLAMALGRRADTLMEMSLPGPLKRALSKGLRSGGGPLVLGLLWGLMPCGLVYMMLLKALEAGSWRMGAAGMAAFGLGTAPLLVGMGMVAGRLGQAWRQRLLRLGGLLVAVMGVLILRQAVMLLRLQP